MSKNNLARKKAELLALSKTLSPGNKYLPGTVGRIARTLSFADHHNPEGDTALIGEIGPGLLIMSENAAGKNAVALGLFGASGNQPLTDQGIPQAEFNLNTGDIPEEYHERIDVLYFCEVFEHLNRWPIDVLSDVKKLLSPNGVLILTTPNVCRLTTRLRILTGRTPFADYFEHVGDGHNHVREYGLEEVKYYCDKAGLKVVGSEYWSIYPNTAPGLLASGMAKVFSKTSNFIAIAATR